MLMVITIHLRLQPGHQCEGYFFRYENNQEEKAKPLNLEEEHSEKEIILEAEK